MLLFKLFFLKVRFSDWTLNSHCLRPSTAGAACALLAVQAVWLYSVLTQYCAATILLAQNWAQAGAQLSDVKLAALAAQARHIWNTSFYMLASTVESSRPFSAQIEYKPNCILFEIYFIGRQFWRTFVMTFIYNEHVSNNRFISYHFISYFLFF